MRWTLISVLSFCMALPTVLTAQTPQASQPAQAVAKPTVPPRDRPDYSWLNQKDGPRPKYVWENHEDTTYHELWYPDADKLSAPEFWPLMQCSWVFNRAMRWTQADNDTMVAYCEGGNLWLTGQHQVARWYSDPRNEITSDGNATTFTKKNTVRRKDAAVIPSFQFHLGQHPTLQLNVTKATDPWQLVASIKGRSGPPIISTDWYEGPKTLELDIAKKLREKGYNLNYAELHFVIGTWAKDAASPSSITFEAELVAKPTVVACLPVIRTQKNAAGGMPISAVVVDAAGNKLASDKMQVVASVKNSPSKPTVLAVKNGVWSGTIMQNLPVGNHEVTISVVGDNKIAPARQVVRVTKGDFWRYEKDPHAIVVNGDIRKPLTGSFQGTFFFADVGLPTERLIQTQEAWDQWDRTKPPGEHQHFWESLTEPELNERFALLEKNGWDLLHLHCHFGIWERIDAFGHPAPHGVEQFAAYVRNADQHGLHVMLALSSYPYSEATTGRVDRTMPYAQTLEAGFKNADWEEPANEPFGSQYRNYLKSFVGLFRDETGVFSWSSSGEGDWINGPKRFKDSRETVKAVDPNHVFVVEPIHSIKMLPAKQSADYDNELNGVRNYSLGVQMPFEQELGLLYRLSRMLPNTYLAEGSYPSSNLYVTMTNNGLPYIGRPEYRIHVRDTFYMGLVHRMPIMVTWDETFTEDEHRMVADVRKNFGWAKEMQKSPVAIIVNDEEASNEGRITITHFEKTFTHLPLDYRFIADAKEARPDEVVIDPKTYDAKAFESFDALSEKLKAQVPFLLSNDYAASYSITKDRQGMLAYLYNTADHTDEEFYLGARYHRKPQPRDLVITLRRPEAGQAWRLYDLNDKRLAKEGIVNNEEIRIANTSHDYLLWVGPPNAGKP